MVYVLDTNILILYLRKHPLSIEIEEKFSLFSANNTSIISIVSKGELHALGLINRWGTKRIEKMDELLSNLLVVDIHAEDVIDMYAEIDAFSQNRLLGKPLGITPRNMGKNDLWIAAATAIVGATLLTTDKDFLHLHKAYFDVAHILT